MKILSSFKRSHIRSLQHPIIFLKSSAFWVITLRSPVESTDISEEHIASIFRIDEKVKQKEKKKQYEAGSNQLVPDFTALYPRRYHSAYSPL
jgi:hypothetical protein